MLDCGVHPAFSGITSLPFFDEIEPGDIDLLLITHLIQIYFYHFK